MRRAAALLLVGILSCAVSTYGLSSSTTVVPLDGLSWGVSNANGSISLKTTLVSCAFETIHIIALYSLRSALASWAPARCSSARTADRGRAAAGVARLLRAGARPNLAPQAASKCSPLLIASRGARDNVARPPFAPALRRRSPRTPSICCSRPA